MRAIVPGAVALLCAYACVFPACPKERPYYYAAPAAGTYFTLRCYSAAPRAEMEKAVSAAFACMRRWELVLSERDARSELSKINAAPDGVRIPISPELADALRVAFSIAEETKGRFDPTLGPLVRLWRRRSRTGADSKPESLALASAASGYHKLTLGQNYILKTVPGMHIDLGGIGKGYMLDRMAEVLRRHGVSRYLLSSGSDFLAGDPPPGSCAWKITVDGTEVELVHAALSTSGAEYQSAAIDGVVESHIIDSETGRGVPRKRSVTVKANTAAEADARATGKYVGK